MSDKLRLALRKGLIEDVAQDFDRLYRRLAPSEVMLFNDDVLRERFRTDVAFSATRRPTPLFDPHKLCNQDAWILVKGCKISNHVWVYFM